VKADTARMQSSQIAGKHSDGWLQKFYVTLLYEYSREEKIKKNTG
jgi:hypothetical protein